MTRDELKAKWDEGSVLLNEIGNYVNSELGIEDYHNAIKILEAIEKFEAIVREMMAESLTKKMFRINFKEVNSYVSYLKKSATETKNAYA